ncbi:MULTISPECIES: DinB family protein [Gordonia]|jgi:uncharacterized damage-inducible protein DinB|uniref:DinB family protein n=1 Tax=Gordonia TaxID=2053 RepID=UPI0030173968
MTEITDLVALFDDESANFRIAVDGVTEEQARATPTVSALSIGGLLKHVTLTHEGWWKTITDADPNAEFDMAGAAHAYELTDDETFAEWAEKYDAQYASTVAALKATSDLDALIPLPTAPWAPEREYRSVRWIVLHMLRELAHHAGHADIIRETLDGQSTTMTHARNAGMDV